MPVNLNSNYLEAFKVPHLINSTIEVNDIRVFFKSSFTVVKIDVNNLDNGLVEHLAEPVGKYYYLQRYYQLVPFVNNCNNMFYK